MDLQVLYEDNHLIAINKPAGYLVQGDVTEDVPLTEYVKDYIKVRYDKPGDVFLGVIHRLDRPVSGALLFARTSKGLARMNELFKKRQVEKVYWAVTRKRPEPIVGSLKHFVGKDRERNVAQAFDTMSNRAQAAGAKEARLRYELIGELNGRHLIQVELETGRPHQIRVQLSKIGCPIEGDIKYGAPQPNRDGSIDLHCRSLAFEHPVKNLPVRIEAELPDSRNWALFGELAR